MQSTYCHMGILFLLLCCNVNVVAEEALLSEGNKVNNEELVNLVERDSRIRSYGWGEYRVGGKCLCCDNMLDGDCVVIYNTERTRKKRIKQIVDGKIQGDINDKKTYFGNLEKRDQAESVSLLLAEVGLREMQDIKKVVVYTIIDEDKKMNFLSNCELGYYDQFGRLQWVRKVESKRYDEPITFEMEKHIFTKKILLRVKGGKNRITEVALFSIRK